MGMKSIHVAKFAISQTYDECSKPDMGTPAPHGLCIVSMPTSRLSPATNLAQIHYSGQVPSIHDYPHWGGLYSGRTLRVGARDERSPAAPDDDGHCLADVITLDLLRSAMVSAYQARFTHRSHRRGYRHRTGLNRSFDGCQCCHLGHSVRAPARESEPAGVPVLGEIYHTQCVTSE